MLPAVSRAALELAGENATIFLDDPAVWPMQTVADKALKLFAGRDQRRAALARMAEGGDRGAAALYTTLAWNRRVQHVYKDMRLGFHADGKRVFDDLEPWPLPKSKKGGVWARYDAGSGASTRSPFPLPTRRAQPRSPRVLTRAALRRGDMTGAVARGLGGLREGQRRADRRLDRTQRN